MSPSCVLWCEQVGAASCHLAVRLVCGNCVLFTHTQHNGPTEHFLRVSGHHPLAYTFCHATRFATRLIEQYCTVVFPFSPALHAPATAARAPHRTAQAAPTAITSQGAVPLPAAHLGGTLSSAPSSAARAAVSATNSMRGFVGLRHFLCRRAHVCSQLRVAHPRHFASGSTFECMSTSARVPLCLDSEQRRTRSQTRGNPWNFNLGVPPGNTWHPPDIGVPGMCFQNIVAMVYGLYACRHLLAHGTRLLKGIVDVFLFARFLLISLRTCIEFLSNLIHYAT